MTSTPENANATSCAEERCRRTNDSDTKALDENKCEVLQSGVLLRICTTLGSNGSGSEMKGTASSLMTRLKRCSLRRLGLVVVVTRGKYLVVVGRGGSLFTWQPKLRWEWCGLGAED